MNGALEANKEPQKAKEELPADIAQRLAEETGLGGLTAPSNTILAFFNQVDSFLKEINLDDSTIEEIKLVLTTERSHEKLSILSNIFDAKLEAISELQQVSGANNLTLSEKISLLGEALFALKILDHDPILAEQVFFQRQFNKAQHQEFERNLENFMANTAFKDGGIFKELLQEEFKGANNQGKTSLLKSFLTPFLKVYDEGHFENLIETVVRHLKNKFYRVNLQISDLAPSNAELTPREAHFLERVIKRTAHRQQGGGVAAKTDYDRQLENILQRIKDPQEKLSALQAFFNNGPTISSSMLIMTLETLPRGESWGKKNSALFQELISYIRQNGGGRWEATSSFAPLDIYILFKALFHTVKDPTLTSQSREKIHTMAEKIINDSVFIQNKKKDFLADIRAAIHNLVTEV